MYISNNVLLKTLIGTVKESKHVRRLLDPGTQRSYVLELKPRIYPRPANFKGHAKSVPMPDLDEKNSKGNSTSAPAPDLKEASIKRNATPAPMPYLKEETFNSLCVAPKKEKFEHRTDRVSVQPSSHCRKYRPGPLEFPGARYWPWGSAEARINEELFMRHRRKFDLSSVNGCQPIPLPPQMPKEQPFLGRTRFPLHVNEPCKKIVCHPCIEPPKCPQRQLVDDCTAEPEQTYANFSNALLTMSHRII